MFRAERACRVCRRLDRVVARLATTKENRRVGDGTILREARVCSVTDQDRHRRTRVRACSILRRP